MSTVDVVREDRALLAKVAELGCIRMFWGAARPCAEYTDGRLLCVVCSARKVLADPTIPTPPIATGDELHRP